MSSLCNQCFICVFVLLFSHFIGAKDLDFALIEKNLQSYEKKITALRQSIDNSVFNDEEILLKLDFDADNLVAFMQDKVVFQAYQGLMRGVQGTLNSRAGNALDQAVLLAKLLKDAGMEARIANGVLSEEQTNLLLSGMANADIPSHIGQGPEFVKALAALAKPHSGSNKLDWQQTKTFKRYQTTLGVLQQVLTANSIQLDNVEITQKLLQESKDYFWVQYRLSPYDDWSNAHPAFKKGSKIEVKPLSNFKDSVPEKYLHQVKIEAFIQQRVGEKYVTHSLMKAWQKPAANLHNVLIKYSNVPSGVDIKSPYNLQQILKNSQYFIPTFNGVPVGDKVFDLKGRLIDSMGKSSQAGALFQTLGDKTLFALDKIENRKDGKSNMQLMAQWLEFTLIQPDGTEFVQKRYLYQAPESQISDMVTKLQLSSEYALLVNNGEQPLSYLAQTYLDGVQAGLPLLKASARKLFHGEDKTAFPKVIPQSEFDLLTQYSWMNSNPNVAKQTIRFRANPNILGFKKGFIDVNKAYFAVDIISNKQRFIQRQGNHYFSATNQSFQQGIWDTASEWLPARFLKLNGQKLDTLKVTSAALAQGIDLQVIKSSDLNKIVAKTSVKNRLKSDIEAGYLVIAPKEKPNNVAMTGWWRINPKTGETLGMTADGGGSEVTEYLIEQAQIALMLVRALGNLQKCSNDSSMNNFEKMCCLAEAHLNNVVGLSFGGVLSKTVGTVGAAVFDIVDFTAELTTGTGIAPSTNGAICDAVDPIPDF